MFAVSLFTLTLPKKKTKPLYGLPGLKRSALQLRAFQRTFDITKRGSSPQSVSKSASPERARHRETDTDTEIQKDIERLTHTDRQGDRERDIETERERYKEGSHTNIQRESYSETALQ